MSYTAAVITISDKGARGERVDTSGPNLCEILKGRGFDVVYTSIIPDEMEEIKAELIRCCDEKKIALVLTTGGTGFSPRDITPEATLQVVRPVSLKRCVPSPCVSRPRAACPARRRAFAQGH